jgi:biopolymer transport protein ExbD
MNGPSFMKSVRAPSDAMEAEIDLDTTPIMNVLIILIPFLASVAVYTHLTAIDLSLPPNVGAGMAGSGEKPKLKLTVVMADGYLLITHGENMLDSLPRDGEEYDYVLLGERLQARRSQADNKDELIVAVDNPILFKHVVGVMDVCRNSGFSKVGLASAPGKEGP